MANNQNSQESSNCGEYFPEEIVAGKARPKTQCVQLAPQLVRMIEGEMVPRLLLMRHPAPAPRPTAAAADSAFSTEHIEELARLLLTHDATVAGAYVEMFRQNGMTTQDICLNLLPAAARLLGKLWEEDRCGFAEVTMGVCSLHQVLHRMTADEMPSPSAGCVGSENNILLSCLPGEQHTFGVLVVAQSLRRAGWDVRNVFPADTSDILQSVRKKSFRLIGLSVGQYSSVRGLTVLIKALRRVSVNSHIGVILGGPALALRPSLCRQVGADATALDAAEAVSWAQGYWQAMTAQTQT